MEKAAAAYAAERFVLQETFLKLKIRGLKTRAASNQERVIMARVRYSKYGACTLHSPNMMLILESLQATQIMSISASPLPVTIPSFFSWFPKCSETLIPLTQNDGVFSNIDLIAFIAKNSPISPIL